MNERIFQLFRKKYCFFIEPQTIFWDKIFKKQLFFSEWTIFSKKFWKTIDFFNEQTILQN